MSEDNWKHRSDSMRCKTCMYFVEKTSAVDAVQVGEQVGRCRRHAPTMNGWPVVFLQDWCGDHKLDENKLPRSRSTEEIVKEYCKRPADWRSE